MSLTHYPYPEIHQFRNTIRTVKERAEFENLLPTISFRGTVKLHGTNASVVFPGDTRLDFYAQSRTRVISPEDDNHGFAKYVDNNNFLKEIRNNLKRGYPGETFVLYGEWFGQSIQSGVAVSSLPKTFIAFGLKNTTKDEWIKQGMLPYLCGSIMTIQDFQIWRIDIDFNHPELSQNRLVEITEAVERECPVGRQLGVLGIGEGVVWSPLPHPSFNVSGLQFKVKGEKHSESRVKTSAAVDVERIENLKVLVDTILTEHRLDKKLESLLESGLGLDIKNTGSFLKLVGSDVYKEESDTIKESGFKDNEVMGEVQKRAKIYWMEKIK